MHNWGAGKARLMSGLSALLQLLDLACHTHSNQPCKNYRLHWFLVFICECLWVCMRVLMWGCGSVCLCLLCSYVCIYTVTCVHMCLCMCTVCGCAHMCSGVRAGYKSGVGDHAGVRAAATSGAPTFLVGAFRCWVELRRAAGANTRGSQTTWSFPIIAVMVIVRSSVLTLTFNLQNVFLWTHLRVHLCAWVWVYVRNPWIQHDWGFEGTLHSVPSCRCCVCSPRYTSAAITNK